MTAAKAPARTSTWPVHNALWFPVPGKAMGRTSLIQDPPDGRVPEMTAAGKARAAAFAEGRQGPPAGPEDRSLWERCITRGVPRLPGGYNNHFKIVQSEGSVAILIEMIHETRIIPLDGSAHLPSSIRQWLGDSRGHWDGDTLVVDTTNFSDKTNFRGSGAGLHVVERITRVSPDTINYEFTVDDPGTWSGRGRHRSRLTSLRSAVGGVDQVTLPDMFSTRATRANLRSVRAVGMARVQETIAAEAAKKDPARHPRSSDGTTRGPRGPQPVWSFFSRSPASETASGRWPVARPVNTAHRRSPDVQGLVATSRCSAIERL